MAKFSNELPLDLIEQFKKLADGEAEKMLGEMVDAGAEVVEKNIRANMKNSFKSTEKLEKCLIRTKTYKTASDDGVNQKVAFYGYFENENGEKVPAPKVVMAMEYGTSERKTKDGKNRGQITKNPFFRKSFKKAEITSAMLKVQEKYINNE